MHAYMSVCGCIRVISGCLVTHLQVPSSFFQDPMGERHCRGKEMNSAHEGKCVCVCERGGEGVGVGVWVSVRVRVCVCVREVGRVCGWFFRGCRFSLRLYPSPSVM